MKLSASKLKDWERCPYYYKLRYVTQEVPHPKSGAIQLGNNVHKVLELFYSNQEPIKSLEEMETILEKCWEIEGFASPEEGKKFYARARKMVRWFWDNQPAPVEKRVTEHYFSIPIGDLGEVNGIFDRVDFDKGTIEVTDYKTGKWVGDSVAEMRGSFQCVLYLWAAGTIFGGTPRMKIVNLHWERTWDIPYNVDNMVVVFRKIGEFVEKCGQNVYEPNVSDKCKWCAAKQICQYWKRPNPITVLYGLGSEQLKFRI